MKSLFLRILPVVVIMSMILVSCTAPKTNAAPITLPTPTAIAVSSPTSLPPLSDDVWDRIMANRKIVVGVSWDYPPFASIDPNFKVVGLDIALIQEIGRRLNIPIDIQNFTFEGLPAAMQINQIDLAVAAISITPERVGQMSFSSIYFVNQTAILTRNDLMVSITDFKQLAGYRVGVQRGTVYEKMAQNQLVDSGLMRSTKLLSYMQTDEAVRDLVENRVDMVVLGEATASYYQTQKNLQIVGKGFGQQDLAVAMRLGTPRLKAEIDRVMNAMLTDGTMLALIQKYVQNDVSGVLPTPIPLNLPTATPLPIPTVTPPPCWDGMKFIADITYADNNMKKPPYVTTGQAFIKTWRVQNTGTCTWTPSYKLLYAYGNIAGAQMSGQPIYIPANVAPGQSIDLSVNMVAPLTQAIYQGFWQIENASGGRFGQTIWVGITTLTAQPTPVATLQGNTCAVTLSEPTKILTVGSDFDAVWMVQNTSGVDWTTDSMDYKYLSGTAMHKKPLYDLEQTIKNGESGQIIVNMAAPSTPGTYSTSWTIDASGVTHCTMSVTVTVR